jgi:hypothetical protein
VKEMKELIRTGEPIMQLAERLASKYGVSELSMRNKLYYVAKSTYKIADWNGPKRRTNAKSAEPSPIEVKGKRVVMYSNHIRIYF